MFFGWLRLLVEMKTSTNLFTDDTVVVGQNMNGTIGQPDILPLHGYILHLGQVLGDLCHLHGMGLVSDEHLDGG